MCVVSKSGSWIFWPTAERCMCLCGCGAPMCLHRSCELHDGKQTKTTECSCRRSQVYSPAWSSLCCLPHRPYIALVSWEVLRLQTRPDAWLHGTDTAPSGSSPPPRRGRRILGVLTGTRTESQGPAASGGTAGTTFNDALFFLFTFVASVRMSLESFTRHCSGTVTSMTFALSCFLLLSVTNLPYQALRMMRPGLMEQQQTARTKKKNKPYCVILMCSKIPHQFYNWAKAIPLCWIYSQLY